MPSFGAQSVPTRHPTGSKHRWRPTNGTTPVAARASTGRRAALPAAPYSRCLAQGAQHLRTPRTSRFEVSTEKHRLRLDAVAAVLVVRRWPTAAGRRSPAATGAAGPSSLGSPGSLELLLASRASPVLLALRDFQRAFYRLGLSQRQIGAVPRIYLLAFQAERRYKQLTWRAGRARRVHPRDGALKEFGKALRGILIISTKCRWRWNRKWMLDTCSWQEKQTQQETWMQFTLIFESLFS